MNIAFEWDEIPKPTQADLDRLNAIKDEDIDFTDIPELTEDFFANAKVGEFYRPKKKQVTVTIDADILDWLKTDSKGYQAKLNSVLRQSMLETVAVR